MSDLPNGFRRLSNWIPSILVAIMISIFSTHYFTDENTARIIIPALHWLFPWATPHMLHIMHMAVRKMAHVAEFALFSATIFHGLRAGRDGWRLKSAVATLVIAAAYAGLDEWHQSFVPFRHAAARDLVIDTLGALLAQVFVWCWATRKWPFAPLRQVQAGAGNLP